MSPRDTRSCDRPAHTHEPRAHRIEPEGTAVVLRRRPEAAAAGVLGVSLWADGSGSMLDMMREAGGYAEGLRRRSKAEAATLAIRELVGRLQTGRQAPNLWFSFGAFHDEVAVRWDMRPLRAVSPADAFDPTQAGVGGADTYLHLPLEAGHEQIVRWRRTRPDSLHVSNVVLVMSDGLCANPQRTLRAALRLKEISGVMVATCLFAGVGDPVDGARLLEEIASGPGFHRTVHSAGQLCDFLETSVTIAGRRAGA